MVVVEKGQVGYDGEGFGVGQLVSRREVYYRDITCG
jgi:hypothetical protein